MPRFHTPFSMISQFVLDYSLCSCYVPQDNSSQSQPSCILLTGNIFARDKRNTKTESQNLPEKETQSCKLCGDIFPSMQVLDLHIQVRSGSLTSMNICHYHLLKLHLMAVQKRKPLMVQHQEEAIYKWVHEWIGYLKAFMSLPLFWIFFFLCKKEKKKPTILTRKIYQAERKQFYHKNPTSVHKMTPC